MVSVVSNRLRVSVSVKAAVLWGKAREILTTRRFFVGEKAMFTGFTKRRPLAKKKPAPKKKQGKKDQMAVRSKWLLGANGC